jgi:hypothetical protein
MRYHHGYGYGGCYHPGWHWGCGPEWPPEPDYGWVPDAPPGYPGRYGRRMRFGGSEVSRRSTLARLESDLASLQEEIRSVEQEIRDLAAREAEPEPDPGPGKT